MNQGRILRGRRRRRHACFDTFNTFDTCRRLVTLTPPAQCEKFGPRGQNAYQRASYGWFFSNATKAESRHKCLNGDTCLRFEQRPEPATESEVRFGPSARGLLFR